MSQLQNQKNQENQQAIDEEQIASRVNKVLEEELSNEEMQPGDIVELELLQETYKVATMGMQSVEVIKPMVKEKALKNLLFKQFNSYKSLAKEIELKAIHNGFDLKPANIINKAMMYGNMLINTINDRSASKLAEMMIQGINMGIISITKVTNNIDSELNIDMSLTNKLMGMLNNNLENLKVYL
ncbi:MAG: hypothetical protein ACOCWI_00285 [Bacillota bacterium]